MARKVIRHCYACGKEYTYCPSCSEDKDKPVWMFSFDTEICRDLFALTSDYLAGGIDKNGVVKRLQDMNLGNRKFETSISNMITECSKKEKEVVKDEKIDVREIKKITPVRKK